MKRVSITDFNGGLNNKTDPTRLPDNVLTAIQNYEYRDLTGLRKRYGVTNHELSNAMLTNVRKFDIWYPNNKPADMDTTDDKIYVVHLAQAQRIEAIEIWTPEDLYEVRGDLSASYILMADIDLADYQTGTGWIPIGSSTNPFTGQFDGNGYTISNVIIETGGTNYNGLFGMCYGAHVYDLIIAGANITDTYSSEMSGALAGRFDFGSITNVHATSPAIDSGLVGLYVGGLVGVGEGVNISRCSATSVDLKGMEWIGGIIGRMAKYNGADDAYGYVDKCYTTGSLTASIDNGEDSNGHGGIVGEINKGEVTNSYSTCTINAYYDAGGITGWLCNGKTNTIINCYFAGEIIDLSGGLSSSLGGIVGKDENWETRGDTVVISSYFDNDKIFATVTDQGGDGLTTANMKKEASFVDWDFTNVWSIEEDTSYPTLR